MNAWARDFDNWAIVDSICFHLFDKTQHAWKQIPKWANAKQEFHKRAAFALLWGLTVHDKQASNDLFAMGLETIEQQAEDDRNFVKKAVNMSLRAIGKRNQFLNGLAKDTAEKLSQSKARSARWIGSHALRELSSSKVQQRLADKG